MSAARSAPEPGPAPGRALLTGLASLVFVVLCVLPCAPGASAGTLASAGTVASAGTFASASTVASVATGSWRWPVQSPPHISRGFDLDSPYGAGHRGIDIGATPGAAVFAPAAGTVRFSGFVVDRPVLSIEHPDGSLTSYEPVDSDLAAGDPVAAGQRIGTLSVEHRHPPEGALHFGVRVDGTYRDPAPRFADLAPPAAVLLPLYR